MEARDKVRHILADSEEKRIKLFRDSIKSAGSAELASLSDDLISKIESTVSSSKKPQKKAAAKPKGAETRKSRSAPLSEDDERNLSFLDMATQKVRKLAEEDARKAAKEASKNDWSGFNDWARDLNAGSPKSPRRNRRLQSTVAKNIESKPALAIRRLNPDRDLTWKMTDRVQPSDAEQPVSVKVAEQDGEIVDEIEEVVPDDVVIEVSSDLPTPKKPSPKKSEKPTATGAKPVKGRAPHSKDPKPDPKPRPKADPTPVDTKVEVEATPELAETPDTRPDKDEMTKAVASIKKGPIADKREPTTQAKTKAAQKTTKKGLIGLSQVGILSGVLTGLSGSSAAMFHYGHAPEISVFLGSLMVANGAIFLKLMGKVVLKPALYAMSIYLLCALAFLPKPSVTSLSELSGIMSQPGMDIFASFVAVAFAFLLAAASYQPKVPKNN
jgi:hypothetical protein